jgi:dTDP-4-amino-4,6-dideoxygalactose transaminase
VPKLAINGGTPLLSERPGLEWPLYDESERRHLMEVLESRKWSRVSHTPPEAGKVYQFEEAFARYQDARYGCAVATGSLGLVMALKAAGVGPGDEVVVPAATFITAASAILDIGATPVFADMDPRTYNLSPAAAEAAITGRTRAIMAVDNGGMPCDMDALNTLAARRGVALVSDCCHSHGSRWKGRGVGALGLIGGFSFQQGKTLSIGEGGMVVADDERVAERMYAAMNAGPVPGRPYPGTAAERADGASLPQLPVTTNLRMSEWQAAIGLAQLARHDAQAERRDANARRLCAGLREIPGVEPIFRDARVTRWSFYFMHFRFLSPEFDDIPVTAFRRALTAEGVPCGAGHTAPLYRHPMLVHGDLGRDRPDYSRCHCPETERVHATESCSLTHALFLGPETDMDRILDAIRKLRENTDELRRLTESGLPERHG